MFSLGVCGMEEATLLTQSSVISPSLSLQTDPTTEKSHVMSDLTSLCLGKVSLESDI